jgi:hypothetical protein
MSTLIGGEPGDWARMRYIKGRECFETRPGCTGALLKHEGELLVA